MNFIIFVINSFYLFMAPPPPGTIATQEISGENNSLLFVVATTPIAQMLWLIQQLFNVRDREAIVPDRNCRDKIVAEVKKSTAV